MDEMNVAQNAGVQEASSKEKKMDKIVQNLLVLTSWP